MASHLDKLIREHAERLDQLAGPIDLTDVTFAPWHDTTTVALVDDEHTWTQPHNRHRWPVIGVAVAAVVAVVVGGLAMRRADPTGDVPADQPTTVAPRRETGGFEGGGPSVTYSVPDSWRSGVGHPAPGDISNGVVKVDEEIGVMFINADDHFYTRMSCPSGLTDDPVGPTSADLVSAWANLPRVDATAPRDVTIDGFNATKFEFTVPDYNEEDDCNGMFFRCSMAGEPLQPVRCANLLQTATRKGGVKTIPNQFREVWVLDVDGTRLMVIAWFPPNISQKDRVAIDEIVASMRIG